MTTVDALLPLSLLESVRAVDTPDAELEAEYVSELRAKRLGLSDTVSAQIRRYSDAVKRDGRPAYEEAVALARLIGRRPDADVIFRGAGERLARDAYATIPAIKRSIIGSLPAVFSRPIALGEARRIADRYFAARLTRVGGFLLFEVADSVTMESAPKGIGCLFYEAGFRDMMRLLVNGAGAIEHTRCGLRGEGTCEWRAEWRRNDRS